MKFKYCKSLISILITSSMLAACQSGSGDKAAAPVDETQVRVETKEQIHLTPAGTIKMAVTKDSDEINQSTDPEEFKNSLNHYSVEFNMPQTLARSAKVIRRINGKSSQLDFAVSEEVSSQFTYVDRIEYQLPSSYAPQFYTYDIYQSSELLTSFRVEIKADLLVEGTKTVSEMGLPPGEVNLRVIYLDSGARLITEGHTYTLTADKLFANNAVIETFSEQDALIGQTARASGKDGGRITMKLNSASGDLQVFMRGMTGKAGEAGQNGSDGLNAGVSGRGGELGVPEPCTSDRYKMTSDSKDVASFAPCMGPRNKWCERAPENGGNGDAGDKGADGENGFAGGNSGDFYIYAVQGESLSLAVKLLPGQGGAGGLGGKGGLGKPGGKAGSSIKPCPAAADGKAGVNGIDGAPGAMGQPGAKGQPGVSLGYCKKLSAKSERQCFQE